MTQERRLAIQMWELIRAHIRDIPKPRDADAGFVTKLKCQFCQEHELDWYFDCWLCQYVRYHDKEHGEGCQRCPLSDGHKGAIIGTETGCADNAFRRVLRARLRKTKLNACDEIIRILNGGQNDKRESLGSNC